MPESEPNLNQTIDRVYGILKRRRWWIILPAAVAIVATGLVISVMPRRYTSAAKLLVVQQQVPQRYVLPTTTTDLREALQATTEEVLSRARLLAIIDEFGLYPEKRTSMAPEALLESMRRDIEIKPIENPLEGRDVNSFTISFVASSPQLAESVTSRLTSLFIQQNVETREHQATTTTEFLKEQLNTTREKLTEAEDQVRAFKMQHLGELPDQQAGNLAIMTGLQEQLQNTMASENRAQEQKQYLQSLSDTRVQAMASDLAHLKQEKAKLLDHYTAKYPAVMKINASISEMEAAVNDLLGQNRPHGAAQIAGDAAPPHIEDISLGQLRGQIEANRLEISNLAKDEKRLKTEIAQYQNRLNATPVREQQLAGILRNYDQLKQDYADLLSKESQSQMAEDLEKRQEGQQFRLVDQPNLPNVPSSPKRMKISLGGAAAGLALGLALAFLIEMLDTSFHSEEEIGQEFALPLVVGIPTLLAPHEVRSRSRRRALEWCAGSGVVLATLIAQLYELYLYRHG